MGQRTMQNIKKPTILIIDDEPSNIHILSEMLKGDHRILFSMSGEDGVRVAELHKPDLILLDVNMPRDDGYTTCKRLKDVPELKDIPVIFITIMGALEDEVKGFEVGAVDYITRPMHAITVIKRIQNHLRIKEHWNALQEMIVIDGLTGIANRRGFDIAFDREWRRSVRKQHPFSVLMADIDHFKAYNDSYGHAAGDVCLRTIAQIFDNHVKHTGGLVARYGGEELVCVLTETCALEVTDLLQRILADLATAAIRHEASPVSDVVTVSIGVATTVASNHVNPHDLLDLADRLMYQAKSAGKNRFVTGVLQQSAHSRGEHHRDGEHYPDKTVHCKPVTDRRIDLWRLAGDEQTPTALLIDDEPAQIEVLTEMLGQDYRIFSANSGEEGLEIAHAVSPDIILLDIVMPVLNGFEVCKRLKNDPILKDTPVIFVTSSATVYDEAQGFEAGAVDYITRPFQPPIVRNRIRNHLELKKQRDILRRLATTDGLTGIANRRGFDEAIEREWLCSLQNSAPISLILADIDYFKAYNDRYGHVAGDDCLRTVAGIFHSQIQRPGDLVARYGGEEIVCLLPDTDTNGALQVAKRLQENISAAAIPHLGSPLFQVITASFGIATVRHGREGTSQSADNPIPAFSRNEYHELINQADTCLYDAKKAGRNHIRSVLLSKQSVSSE